MLDSGNHSYWNALGVISMSKGKDMLLHPVCGTDGLVGLNTLVKT